VVSPERCEVAAGELNAGCVPPGPQNPVNLVNPVQKTLKLAVSITEPVSVQKVRRFLRLTAKYALKMGADFMEKAMVGYADIASSPMDALAAMIGEKDVPKVIAQGVLDVTDLPAEGEERTITVQLIRPLTGKSIGSLTLILRA